MNRPTILVVDDEPLITSMLHMVLDISLEVQVVTTNSPAHALALLQRDPVALLITDYLMPDLNGLKLVRTLRELGSTIPVILLTGYCDEPELAVNTNALVPFEVIVKPWNNEQLVQRIRTMLSLS